MNKYVTYVEREGSREGGSSTRNDSASSSSNFDNELTNVGSQSIPKIFDGELFKIVSVDGNNKLKVNCNLCSSTGNKILSGCLTSTGNFKKHIQALQPHALTKFEKKRDSKRKLIEAGSEARGSSLQSQNIFEVAKRVKTSRVPEKESTDAILNYIIEEMKPLSTVEKKSFKHLICVLAPSCHIPDRRKVSKLLSQRQTEMLEHIKKVLKEQKYLCTTADIWSTNNKSYLGMSVHFIDEMDNFKRKSFALSCSRLQGHHTHDVIAKAIFSVHEKFNINISQITHTVTDNAANFGKAFDVFKESDHEIVRIDSSNIEIIFDNDIEEPEHIQIEEMIDWNVLAELDIELPPQMRCCAHSLNLLATTDAAKAKIDNDYKKIYYSTFAKAQSLWNVLSRSTYASDKASEICNTKFIRPNQTRWNATYSALKCLYQKKDSINVLFDELKLTRFKNNELIFIEEYIKVMEPVAIGLDILQGENEMYLGYVIPTVRSIRTKLEQLTHLTYCQFLINMLIEKLAQRFEYAWNFKIEKSKNFILATASHPKFKLNWTNGEEKLMCQRVFLSECDKISDGGHCNSEDSSTSDAGEDFFSVLDQSTSTKDRNVNLAQMQALSFLNDKDKTLSILNKYPIIKQLFLKYNTTLPSSAPIERLFSSGGQIMTPRRNKLSDFTFEMLLLLKANNIRN